MRKILFVIESLSNGGAERVTSQLANYISKKNIYEVYLITYTNALEKEYELDTKIKRFNIIISGNKMSRFFSRIKALRNTIRNINPDCIVSLATTQTVFFLTLSKIGIKCPIILSERNDPTRYKKKTFMRMMRYFAFNNCDGLVFQTEMAQAYFSPKLIKKSVIILNPINQQLPSKYEGEKKKRIVNFCRLAKQKNLPLLIDAFEVVVEKYSDYSLHIFGDGPEKENLTEIIRKKGLNDKITLHGYTTDIYHKIRDAAMFVSTSNYEGISNSMLESMALGIPTICTDCPVGGAKRTIQHKINGLLIPVNDKEKLIQGIIFLIENAELAKKMGEEAFKIRSVLSIDKIGLEWISYIESIIERS